jgi:5S rRNA maturation endonuclease (ribonuclease M5)
MICEIENDKNRLRISHYHYHGRIVRIVTKYAEVAFIFDYDKKGRKKYEELYKLLNKCKFGLFVHQKQRMLLK